VRFFVVDDDPDILALVGKTLTDAGHQCETALTGRQALQQIPQSRPDCVITDVMMPEMDGFELTRELRRRSDLAGLKIVVLSVKSYDFDRRRARELGADGYIVKPFVRDNLLPAILKIVSDQVVVSYWGVHGTMPVCGSSTVRYGGNTPCVSVEVGGEPLTIFDCGTGIKRLSDHILASKTERFSARVFISHPHWDHVNTIPFFVPLYARGNQFEIHGPYQGDLTIENVVSAQMESVYFPVTVREFGARLHFRDLREEGMSFGPVRIETKLLSHPGYCLGYRLTSHGRSVCYITDNEMYPKEDRRRDERYMEQLTKFVGGADVLITDTTYRDHEYPAKADYGHSSVSQVAELAARAQVKRLHLFHHDPDQDDADIDAKLLETRAALDKLGAHIPCDAPAEGSDLEL
jgi:phosphoribosyl 1,2-cyclic phosphodiesterase